MSLIKISLGYDLRESRDQITQGPKGFSEDFDHVHVLTSSYMCQLVNTIIYYLCVRFRTYPFKNKHDKVILH